MGLAMERNSIDLCCDSTCVKVGCFSEVDVQDCNTTVDF